MELIVSAAEMQKHSADARAHGKTIGLVPTMGSLHEGHLSLIALAKKSCDVVVTSIFVNPTQFAPHEDFARYPRDLAKDEESCRRSGTTILFAPEQSDMYPEGYSTFVSVEGLSSILEGKSRPTHFRGVATIVTQLFLLTKPHRAFFGQKDAQQCAVVRKLVKDLRLDLEVIIGPIVRERDGLAMSSRNIYLSPEQRSEATVLYASLLRGEELIRNGERNAAAIIEEMKSMIQRKKSAAIDYVELVDPENLVPLERIEKGGAALLLLAVRFGTTRLIDNTMVELR